MSALGQKQTYAPHKTMSALGQKQTYAPHKTMSALPQERTCALQLVVSASLIGRFGSSAFRLSTNCSVDVAHGLVLLSGIGTRALPSWGSRTRWTNLRGGLAGKLTAGPSRHAISPHPSSREGHHSTTSSRFSYRV